LERMNNIYCSHPNKHTYLHRINICYNARKNHFLAIWMMEKYSVWVCRWWDIRWEVDRDSGKACVSFVALMYK
jgi:hypothetical protein